MNEQEQLLLGLADDELIVGWRDSEWTGIAPVLEEDVAFSSIAQNEIGHARAVYQLLTEDADALAFDRRPDGVPLRAARRAAAARLGADDRAPVAVRARRRGADRAPEEVGRRGASPASRRRSTARRPTTACTPRCGRSGCAASRASSAALEELWPYALGIVPAELRPELAERAGRPSDDLSQAIERGETLDELRELWEEMTVVRRSAPGAQW